jgi:dienelactone hydrolase
VSNLSERAALGFQPYLDGHYDASIQLQLHIYRRSEAAFERWERHKDGITTAAQVEEWQRYVRERALAAIGGLPPGDTPLEPEIVDTLRGDGYDVENVIFQSLPRVYVTSNLYLPRGRAGRTGAVLLVHGHQEFPRTEPEYQAVCQRLVRNGLVVLAIDPLGQGERKGYLDASGNPLIRAGTAEHTYAGVQCWWLGHSIARYFVHDARRAIDYLCSRPEVDPARIGTTGNSGGGTQSTWMMLLDPRLAAAAPGTYVLRRREYLWTGQPQDAEQIVPGGTAAGLDHEDFLIAMAPRPTLVLAADYDWFSIEGTIATIERARRIYRLLGKEENLGLVRSRSTHQFHPVLARAATEFFAHHLLGADPREVDHTEPKPVDPRLLTCTRSGQVLIDRPHTRRVFDLNLAEYQALPPKPTDPDRRAEVARSWLAEAVHRDRRPTEFHARWLPGPEEAGVSALHGYWWSEPEVLNAGVFLRPIEGDYASLLLALVDQGTSDVDAWRDWLLARVRGGQAILVLDVRGTGAIAPHAINPRPFAGHHGTIYKLVTDLLCLGDSLEAMRIYDVLRAVELVQGDPEIDLGGRPVHLFGVSRGAFRGYLAASLATGIRHVELRGLEPDPLGVLTTRLYPQDATWHCLLPGMPRHFDLADLAPLFAGRQLVLE